MLDSPLFKVRIKGEFACFTRPEMKVERVSYEVITPSAARGVLEAILWKPAIHWVVRRVHVLAPIQWASFKRNEVKDKLSVQNAQHAMGSKELMKPLVAGESRTQRHTLALRNVDYVVEAGFRMNPDRIGPEDNPSKFTEMFTRRLGKGQCFRTPYLGCREFPAHFELQSDPFETITETRNLGWMLHDIEFDPKTGNRAHFFEAKMEGGRINVPASLGGRA